MIPENPGLRFGQFAIMVAYHVLFWAMLNSDGEFRSVLQERSLFLLLLGTADEVLEHEKWLSNWQRQFAMSRSSSNYVYNCIQEKGVCLTSESFPSGLYQTELFCEMQEWHR